MMKWQFDDIEAQQGLVSVISDMVGYRLGKMLNPETGQEVDIPACYIRNQQIPASGLPRVILNYQGSSDLNGTKFTEGLGEVRDPKDPTKTVEVPYYDTYINYLVLLVAEGDGAESILREIRKKLLIPKYKQMIRDSMNSGLQTPIRPVTPAPDLMATQYQPRANMLLSFDTRDRVYDLDGSYFNAIDSEGVLHKDELKTDDPISVNTFVPESLKNN